MELKGSRGQTQTVLADDSVTKSLIVGTATKLDEMDVLTANQRLTIVTAGSKLPSKKTIQNRD